MHRLMLIYGIHLACSTEVWALYITPLRYPIGEVPTNNWRKQSQIS